MTEMRKDLQKLAQRYDSFSVMASATPQRERSKSPGPRVTFKDPPVSSDDRRPGPSQGRVGFEYQPQG